MVEIRMVFTDGTEGVTAIECSVAEARRHIAEVCEMFDDILLMAIVDNNDCPAPLDFLA